VVFLKKEITVLTDVTGNGDADMEAKFLLPNAPLPDDTIANASRDAVWADDAILFDALAATLWNGAC